MSGGMEAAEAVSGAELVAGGEDLAGITFASVVEASTSTAVSDPETLLELVTTETASIAISIAPLLTEEALLPLLLLLFWATHPVAPRTTNQTWIFSHQGDIVTSW